MNKRTIRAVAAAAAFGALLPATPNVARAQQPSANGPAAPQGLRPVGPVSPPFRDVPANHWAFEAVEKLRRLGILSGYPNGTLNGGAPRR